MELIIQEVCFTSQPDRTNNSSTSKHKPVLIVFKIKTQFTDSHGVLDTCFNKMCLFKTSLNKTNWQDIFKLVLIKTTKKAGNVKKPPKKKTKQSRHWILNGFY